uniref:Uncharacterized protein n=1 Tax=viral metagenome TaxID=1070528 RepID=A0A6C0L1P9_9ZZZZ
MTKIKDYKNHAVFDCVNKIPCVNTLHENIVDFDIETDIKICNHCFYESKDSVALKMDTFSKVKHNKSKRTRTKNKSKRKNKSNRR